MKKVLASLLVLSALPFGLMAKGKKKEIDFWNEVDPIMARYCYDCHDEDIQKGDIQLDHLDPDMVNGPDGEIWHAVLDVINSGDMPPKKKKQPKDDERRLMTDWMTNNLKLAKEKKKGELKTVMRRMTREQYSNTLGDLLGVRVDLSAHLPPDPVSPMGFTNDGGMQHSSKLLQENYQDIARKMVKKAIGPVEKPHVYRYSIDLGKGISKAKNKELKGFQSVELNGHDFTTTSFDEAGEVIEKNLEAISVDLRGSSKGLFTVDQEGLILNAAKRQPNKAPHFWRPPNPNLKVLLQRAFPEEGNVKFSAQISQRSLDLSEYYFNFYWNGKGEKEMMEYHQQSLTKVENDALVFPKGAIVTPASELTLISEVKLKGESLVVGSNSKYVWNQNVPTDGYYQVEMVEVVNDQPNNKKQKPIHIKVSKPSAPMMQKKEQWYHITQLPKGANQKKYKVYPIVKAYLKKGEIALDFNGKGPNLSHVVMTPLGKKASLELEREKLAYQTKMKKRKAKSEDMPVIAKAFLGSRTDDGENTKYFDGQFEISAKDGIKEISFIDRLENFPLPALIEGDTDPLSGILVMGLYNHYNIGVKNNADSYMMVHSMSFEAPYYESWPPKSYVNIFGSEPKKNDLAETEKIIRNFMKKAFRGHVDEEFLSLYVQHWNSIKQNYPRYEDGVAETLIAILSSPQFLYLFEPAQEDSSLISELDLATRLSYFLWNRAPDAELLDLANKGELRNALDTQIDRMLKDDRSEGFVNTFGYEWLHLERLDQVELAPKLNSKLTPKTKALLKQETLSFLDHVLKENLSIENFVDSDFVMLNNELADFYKIKGVEGGDIKPYPVDRSKQRGGLISQASFHMGHSDGKEAHPIKRAVWLMEKMLATEPPPAPPNVPEIDDADPNFKNLTLRQKLEKHRDNASCRDCHAKIDPWGLAFQQYSALGEFMKKQDASTTLPDGKEIKGISSLKAYLGKDKMEQVATSVTEHLLAYALGRSLSYLDEDDVHDLVQQTKKQGYGFKDLLKNVIEHELFNRS